jgi:hypothetical protein
MKRDHMGDVEYAAAFELVRHIVRQHLRRQDMSLRMFAHELRVVPSTLRRFMDGGGMSLSLWDAVTTWTAGLTKEEKPVAHSGMMGLAVLAAALPMRVRRRARNTLAIELAHFLAVVGEDVPDWLEQEIAGE